MSPDSQYLEDLAYIHDQGFSRFAEAAAIGLLELLGPAPRDVVELGCGSGTLARALLAAGHRVWGVDISPAMIELARSQAARGQFAVGSLWDYAIPPCHVVVSVGECLNYEFDRTNSPARLRLLFQRIYAALAPGGHFVFDILLAGRVRGPASSQRFTQGPDWLVAVDRHESTAHLTRRIISFRQLGRNYRKSEETHHVRKYNLQLVKDLLREARFDVATRRSYSGGPLPPNHTVVLATKP